MNCETCNELKEARYEALNRCYTLLKKQVNYLRQKELEDDAGLDADALNVSIRHAEDTLMKAQTDLTDHAKIHNL